MLRITSAGGWAPAAGAREKGEDTMRRFVAAVSVVAMMGLGANAAFAGEITGSGKGGPNGDGTPGGTLNASSQCAFSGLEDGAATPGTVQNYGHRADDPFFGQVFSQRGASTLDIILNFPAEFGGPTRVTTGCNPHAGGGE